MEFKNKWVEYNGYVMRSRAELGVAYLLDNLGIHYLYEYMPFDGFHGYLPDFFLPNLNVFIEVKGKLPTAEEKDKCEALSKYTGMPVVIAYGKPKIFSHFDDNYERNEVGWCPMVYHHGKWGSVAINLLCRMVYRFEGRNCGERFVSWFDSDDVARIQTVAPSCMQMHDEIGRNIGKVSRMIYEHNAPVNKERLCAIPELSRYESLVVGFLHERAAA